MNRYGARRGGSRGYTGYGTPRAGTIAPRSRSGATSGWFERRAFRGGNGRYGGGRGYGYRGHGYYGYGYGAGLYVSFGYGYWGFGYSWGYPYCGQYYPGYYYPYSYYPSYCYGYPYYWYPYYWHGYYRYPYYYPYYPRLVLGVGPYYYSSYYYPYYYPYSPYDDTTRAPENPVRETDPSDPAVERINELIEGERFEEAGLALFQQDEYDLAAEFFKKAIYKQGDDASSTLRLRLGVAYFAAGDHEMADFAIRNGLSDGLPAKPLDVKGLYSHPATFDEQYTALGDTAYAEGASPSARFTFAFLATQVGDAEAARPVLDGLLLEDPNDGASRALRESLGG